MTSKAIYVIVVYENERKREMDFCLRGKGSEARSSQTATRLLAVLWFESLLLVWRLHSRTIRPVARFLFAGGKGNCVCIRAQPQQRVPACPWARPCRSLFKEEFAYELLDLTRCRAGRRQRNSETYFCLRLQNEIPQRERKQEW